MSVLVVVMIVLVLWYAQTREWMCWKKRVGLKRWFQLVLKRQLDLDAKLDEQELRELLKIILESA